MLKLAVIFVALIGTSAWGKTASPSKRDVASMAKSSNHIQCMFTEPFYNIDMNVKRKTMKVISPMGDLMDGKIATERTDEIDNVTGSESGGVWTFNYTSADGTKTAILTVNTHKKGSDGMSEKTYDAEGSTPLFGGPNSGIGGCNFVR